MIKVQPTAAPAFPKVAVIILNCNQPEYTLQCALSVSKSDYPNLETVVVDNGSLPDQYGRLRQGLPQLVILRSETNLGFARGNNLGLHYALEHGADYALVINNDTLVDPRMISQLVQAGEADPNLGLLGPVIYYLQEPEKVWFAGYRFNHGIYLLRRGLHLKPPLEPVEYVDFVCGCALMIRRPILETIGLLPEEYFIYYEDLDFCFRVKKAGWKIGCVTEAKMWHAISAYFGGPDSPMKQYHQVKGSLIFYRKYSRGLKLWINLGLRFGHAFYTLVKASVKGQLKGETLRQFAKGVYEGWKYPR